MRSQLRLRIVLPVAVLGLLGVGVGAFAMGGPPDGSGAPLTTATTTPTTTEEKKPGPPSRNAWAKRANKLCAKANSEFRALGMPAAGDVNDFVAYFRDVLAIAKKYDSAFLELGWPKGGKALVLRGRELSAHQIELGTKLLAALEARDEARFLQLVNRVRGLSSSMEKINKKLGTDRCNEDPFAPADPERGLAGALRENRVVVVLFYVPGSAYDTIQAREARAGAAAGGAGFLAVDVSKDREVASLAEAFQVRDAPAILVVRRGFRVAVRIDGYADRETVAQAADNARS